MVGAVRARRLTGTRFRRSLLAAAVVTTGGLAAAMPARSDTIPYALPVQLPATTTSPAIDPAAPYTPAVLSLIAQLLPSGTLTLAQVQNASTLMHDGTNSTCHNVGPVGAPAAGSTTPGIAKECWTDAQGVQPTSGPNIASSTTSSGTTLTTAPQELLGLASTFDTKLGNAWGQVTGAEARELMVTGLFGPQTDPDIYPNWGRGHQTTGEDPYLSQQMVIAQINGVQGQHTMAQMKHFAGYNAQNQNAETDVQDQALHEILLTPYEGGFTAGKAAAGMCSYQLLKDTSTTLPAAEGSLMTPGSPYASGTGPTTWPLNEAHFACEQPLLAHIMRDTWGSVAMIGSDYPAIHSTTGLFQGLADQEMPTTNGFYNGGNGGTDPTGSTCADSTGLWEPCTTAGAVHVGGVPNNFQNSGMTGCPANGCTLNQAIVNGGVPLSLFKQSLARILYQEERFGMLGCDDTPVAATCTNPGGIGSDRTGTAPLPAGPSSGATPANNLGTEAGDAAVSEKGAEEGSVLLKNDGGALPIKPANLAGGIAVVGPNAEYLVAAPSREASTGFPDRIAINPLQQLQALSGNAAAFSFNPANGPTGEPVPSSALSTSSSSTTGNLNQTTPTVATVPSLDFTTASSGGQLAAGSYSWSGYVYVPSTDNYTFRFQQSAAVPNANVTFALGANLAVAGRTTTLSAASAVNDATVSVASITGLAAGQSVTIDTAAAAETATILSTTAAAGGNPAKVTFTAPLTKAHASGASLVYAGLAAGTPAATATARTLAAASTFYNGQYQGTVPVNFTRAGYTEGGLANRQFAAGELGPGYYPVTITFNNSTTGPASFRFAYSRTDGQTNAALTSGDIADAANAARGKSMALVFAHDSGTTTASGPTSVISTLTSSQVNLINAVAAVNPNTVVVLNTAGPVVVKPWIDNPNVKAVINMWNAGSEGGTATARLLLGQANPSGHTAVTWPAATDSSLWMYNQTKPLYPGDTLGPHPERLSGLTGGGTNETEGIYTGYRYYDQEGAPVQYPFGYGLSYTNFGFSNLKLTPRFDGTIDVDFDVKNTGSVAGDEVPQVYVGAGPDVSGIQQAVRSLNGFDRVTLAAGETKHETIKLNKRAFQYWDTVSQNWVTNYGPRTIWVGDADAIANLPLSGTTAPLTSTSTSGGVNGTVPATLALTLGTPASFGAFTPGLAKDYGATMTANVVSTAGDGALSVADPSSTATGHLVNGSFSLPSPLQANASSPAGVGSAFAPVGGSANPLLILSYSGPTSNDPVTIGFQQHIGSSDALRTGSYSKTLTFTLSTTSP
jgi:beta-glucosidase-like glycosyl hydrolase